MKIALLGTAPSSRMLAPFNDPEWQIWACSPANMDLPRSDLRFELHSLDRLKRDAALHPYLKFLQSQKVFLQEKDGQFPLSLSYPKDEMVEKYGSYFFTSSFAWMMAMAIEQRPEVIGLWGVDMAASEEYGYQRAGCHYFMQKAKEAGIEVFIPPESDLAEATPLYGFCESTAIYKKLDARKRELQERMEALKATRIKATTEEAMLAGALQNLEYVFNTWAK